MRTPVVQSILSAIAVMHVLDSPPVRGVFAAQQAILAGPREQSPYPGRATLPVPNATLPFWIKNLDADQTPSLTEGSEGALTTDADVCIIGSGITGVSAAYHIATRSAHSNFMGKEKVKVVILEAREFCQFFCYYLTVAARTSCSNSTCSQAVARLVPSMCRWVTVPRSAT